MKLYETHETHETYETHESNYPFPFYTFFSHLLLNEYIDCQSH